MKKLVKGYKNVKHEKYRRMDKMLKEDECPKRKNF